MASIKERKDKDGKNHYHVQIRIKGFPPQYASFKRKTDAERWIQQTEAFLEWMKKPGAIYFKRFAIDRGYHPNRLAEFAEQNEKFSGVYERVKAWQEIRRVPPASMREY